MVRADVKSGKPNNRISPHPVYNEDDPFVAVLRMGGPLLNIVEGEHTTDGGWKRVQVKPRRARTSAIDVGMGEGNLERSSERSTRINRPDGSTTADPNAAKVKDCMCDSTWERCRMCDRGKMEKQRSNWDIEYID